ncbi:MAG: helix-turn-helix domain-containing protein [Alphaproteobacteria bacterium]|nr:helix-turn-helix domain-containing protein [Alphaproteobacteria bacterium]
MTESIRSCEGEAAGGLLRRGVRGRPVDEEVRRLAVAAVVVDGMSVSAAARRFGLSRDSVDSWVKRFRERGHVRRERMGGSASRIEPHRERILRIIEARPAISMYGLRDALAAEGVSFSASAVQSFLKRNGLERERRLARARRRRKRWTER